MQRKEELDGDEEYAVERLLSWLSRVGGADGNPLLDEVLDETQREFLLSYRLPESEADSTPGGSAQQRSRQYILPARTPRGSSLPSLAAAPAGVSGGMPAADAPGLPDVPSRASSEEVEADGSPELAEMLRKVRGGGQQAGTDGGVRPGNMSTACAACAGRASMPSRAGLSLWFLRTPLSPCQLDDWESFDVFRLAELTDGRPLQTVALALLRKRGLIARLGLPEDRLRCFLSDVEEAYHGHNAYHNSCHAADVTQVCVLAAAAGALGRRGAGWCLAGARDSCREQARRLQPEACRQACECALTHSLLSSPCRPWAPCWRPTALRSTSQTWSSWG